MKLLPTLGYDRSNYMTDIVTALNEGVVSFTYKKSDGTTRQATGTTKTDLIPEGKRPTTDRNTPSSQTISYYDTGKSDWRSFSRSALDVNSVKSEATA